MEINKKENIGWIDLLRVIACFLVVVSHCCDPFVGQSGTNQGAFLTGVFTGSLVRPCVPLFTMMTGVLLFPICISMGDFYKKRIGRLIPPLIFWSIALPVLFFIYLNFINPASQNPAIVPGHTLNDTLTKFYTFLFNFNFDTTPLWYLYMLIGLYLIMPIVGVWLIQATQKEIKLVLYIWVISLILPYIKMAAPLLGYTGNYGDMGILGNCTWNAYGSFYYVSGFIGYLILAYYLVKYPLTWSWKKMLSITVPMFVAGYLITSFGYLLTQKYFPGNWANLEIVWYFTGINVFMMTLPVFVIVQKLNIASSPQLSSLASMTFGIYLCHFVFVEIAYDVFDAIDTLPSIIHIICMALSVFFVCYLIVRTMKHFRLTRRFVQ